MPNEMKMWCLCRKNDERPIKIVTTADWSDDVAVIGFATKKSLIESLGGEDQIEHDEEIRHILF